MALRLTNREVDDVTVVTLDGRIVLGEESGTLRERVKSLLAEGKKKLVLDLKNVTQIDSSGLGALVRCSHEGEIGRSDAAALQPGSRNNKLLQMTKLMTVFEISNSEGDAVSSFSKSQSAPG